MNTKSFFYSTLVASVIVQIISGIIEISTAIFASVSPEFNIIRQLLFLEIAVQAIEGLFYIWLLLNFTSVTNVTPKRYIDWTITTPTMLVTLIFYLIFLERREKNQDTVGLNFFDLVIENGNTISNVFILNWAMLFFGYLGEMNILSTLTGVLLGFVPFLLYYYIIYQKYALNSSSTGIKIFWYFFIFWSLYGVVAILPYHLKNGLYNILDLFAKNFFGIFLSYIILTGLA
jgi:bacteriorhodopsin